MSERVDLELRLYLTGRPGGQVEWQAVAVREDGQTEWIDGQIHAWAPGRAVVPPELAYVAGHQLRRLCRSLRELPTA